MRRHTVNVIEYKNQMCNQLFWGAGLLAASIEYGFDVKMFTFEYEDKFELNNHYEDEKHALYTLNTKEIEKHRKSLKWKILFNNKNKIVFDIGFDESGKKLDDALKQGVFKRVNYVEGWPFYNVETLKKHRERVVEFFRPHAAVIEKTKSIMNEYRDYKYRVAVHVRRKDYKTWQEGRFYFSNQVYHGAMEHMANLLQEKTLFIVFSDEPETLNELEDDKYDMILSNRNAIEDLTLMSKCDFIIAPPSSFSGWASYSGNVPLFRIMNSNAPTFTKEDFGTCWISNQYIENLRHRLFNESESGKENHG